ncbi:translation initiation factor IF-2 subunit beta [Methanoplanus sp. FWC-SCC4]|uniref:Translation initiation factor 2 subunit beta n=1 Tax=Methanochimaera problematica TaxID=2609417 RepID=A0AA97FD00_9EURY|nr:translation initiation factor IF-2 subunit beta [Methanoplanus sp. FWC-SCC4]WOF16689.1 translation initiation factor IF-2 subunit beta [Methanoplanus sp. FWC-SCC4]
MTDPYESLLKQAYSNITEKSGDLGRFTVPAARVYIEGKTTVFENFAEIASTLRREQDHFMKYLLSEIGTAGKIDGNRAVFNGKFDKSQLEKIIDKYTQDYVICSECGKPDTRLVKDGRITLLRCDACGGHRPVKKRKTHNEGGLNQVEEGKEMTVQIEYLSKRGDGVAKVGKYTLYIKGAKPGQNVRVKITRVAGSIAFTEKI